MSILLLTLFIGMVLTLVGIACFGISFQQGDYEYTDALSLLPIEEEKHEASAGHLQR